ncbi:lipid kinase, YegS/Rv2252/BmrU family [Catalinimonas alkaloidigena]|uniref:Lipid kinase, YegS/Rv2252/BmrU family n=1 Tax=Catalinimonas alkaloidigena TaxID=1075417 RepID=A0A1G9DZZ0_9BACT|nr:diacylglycerol kinase family protein [Catalinimonas alkaloidigena]SDK69423.1 lipid kinase, YegS/Rv2252/BmrU family [Catalinimonas alkaloidigena]
MQGNDRRRVWFVVNPLAGKRTNIDLAQLIRDHASPTHLAYEIHFSQYAGHSSLLAQEALAAGVEAVIAVGGDGTINEVASQLVGSSVALGIVPFGSGNGLARHLHIPLEPVRALQNLAVYSPYTIDTATLNGRPFFCTAGVGFDAHVGALFARSVRRGFRSYVTTTLQEYFKYESHRYRLCWDDQSLALEAFTITFANAGQYGNNAWIAPKADIADGVLDLCVLRPFPHYVMPVLGTQLFRRTLDQSPYLDIHPVKKVVLECDTSVPTPLHIDGEPLALEGPFTIAIRPGSLRVLC